MRRHAAVAASILAAAALASGGCVYAPLDLGLGELGKVQEITLKEGPEDAKVFLLRIDGEITSEPESHGLFELVEGTTAQVKDALDHAEKDDAVKALVLRISSPGGGVTASDVIYREIQKWKERTGKKVVALFMDTAASGGYYVAQAADVIVAHPTTVTGSIGVITMLPDLSGLGKKIGVEVNVVKSGELKDMGSPFKPLAEPARKVFQKLIDDMYARFVSVVAEGRKGAGLTREAVLKLADGRVYTADEAKALKLVDQIGYFDDALERALLLAHVPAAKVVTYVRKGIGTGMQTVYSRATIAPIEANLVRGGGPGEQNLLKIDGTGLIPRRREVFNYLWVPEAR